MNCDWMHDVWCMSVSCTCFPRFSFELISSLWWVDVGGDPSTWTMPQWAIHSIILIVWKKVRNCKPNQTLSSWLLIFIVKNPSSFQSHCIWLCAVIKTSPGSCHISYIMSMIQYHVVSYHRSLSPNHINYQWHRQWISCISWNCRYGIN